MKTNEIPAGYNAAYIATAVDGDDVNHYVLNQQQFEEVQAALKANGSQGRTSDAVHQVLDNHNLYDDNGFTSIRKTLEYLIAENMIIAGEFTFIDC